MTLDPPGSYITSIEIEGLFGESDVKISLGEFADPRLMIVYGPNGSGKTTILEIAQSLLSHEDNSGHRTRIAQIPFAKASIRLTGGTVVEAKKREGLIGSYDWVIRKPGADPLFLHVKADRGKVFASNWDLEQNQRHSEMLKELHSIVGRVVSLDDKRTFYTEGERTPRLVERRTVEGKVIRVIDTGDASEDDNDPVFSGLTEVVGSVRREALFLSNRGSQGAQGIYTSLLNKILSTHSSSIDEASTGDSIRNLVAQLIEAQERSETLASYGLVAQVQHQPMIDALSNVSEWKRGVVVSVITPYIESLSARLNAIQSLHDSLNRWVEDLNRFLAPKTLRFKIGEEIQIRSKQGRLLPARDLSSGERHLLLLLTKAFLLRTQGGLLLVDEPELSLNSIWQRGLIQSMVQSFGGAGCQLIVATHSLEIAAKYQQSLVEIA